MPKHPIRDVIVLLPGILGSVLERDGKEVWAPGAGAAWRALWSLGRSITDLELTSDRVDADVLPDGVRATRLVPDLHLVPGLWSINGYSGIRRMITENFDVVPGRTYLEFAYDWRRDNRVAARLLARTVEPALYEARQHDPQAKLVLIGHSMGGLVSRYYLEQLGGWQHTRALITFGTPYRGSLNALDFLVHGFRKKVGPLTVADLSRLLRSLTSVYQLLPIYPCVENGDGTAARPAETDLPDVDRARAATALTDFHRAIEAGVAARPPGAYDIHPVVGLTQPTLQSARADGSGCEMRRLRRTSSGHDVDESGDGTVPRVSATPIEMGNPPAAVYASQTHGSLQNVASVHTQLLGLLTGVEDLDHLRDVRAGLALTVDELFVVDEPIPVQVDVAVPRLTLEATVRDLATGRARDPVPMSSTDGRHTVELPPLAAGDYRVEVTGAGRGARLVQPVAGLLTVTGPEPGDAL